MNVLVTGGCGYIGSVLVPMLLNRGHRVRVFDKLYFGDDALRVVRNAVDLVPGDVRTMADEVLDGIDAVIHLGSLSNDPSADFHPQGTTSINLDGTVHLAHACKRKGITRFTFASTCAVYGLILDETVDESHEAVPQSIYAESKLLAETRLLDMADESFCPVILRQATVFGLSPRMRWDIVLNAFVMHAFRTGRLDVWYGGEAWRPLVHVRDCACAHILCIESDPEAVRAKTFNVVQDNYQILDLAQRVSATLALTGVQVDIDVNRDRVDRRSYRTRGDLIQRELGYVAAVTPEAAVHEIADALRTGVFTNFDHPAYYNLPWMKLLLDIEDRISKTGRIL